MCRSDTLNFSHCLEASHFLDLPSPMLQTLRWTEEGRSRHNCRMRTDLRHLRPGLLVSASYELVLPSHCAVCLTRDSMHFVT